MNCAPTEGEVVNTPRTAAELDARLDQYARSLRVPVSRVRVVVSSVIVAQMLPGGVVIKGGLGIKLRLGELGTRATSDLDAVVPRPSAGASPYEPTIVLLARILARRWGSVPPSKTQRRRNPDAPDRVAYTGTVRAGDRHDPGVHHPEYLMQPVRVTISFLGRPWSHVDLELAQTEIDLDTAQAIPVEAGLSELFDSLNFGPLAEVAVLRPEVQIAQKIHALTSPTSDRAHDLVDIQLLWTDLLDQELLEESCRRTFEYRHEHAWPPLPLRDMTADRARYSVAATEARLGAPASPVRADLDAATAWLTSRIEDMSGAS